MVSQPWQHSERASAVVVSAASLLPLPIVQASSSLVHVLSPTAQRNLVGNTFCASNVCLSVSFSTVLSPVACGLLILLSFRRAEKTTFTKEQLKELAVVAVYWLHESESSSTSNTLLFSNQAPSNVNALHIFFQVLQFLKVQTSSTSLEVVFSWLPWFCGHDLWSRQCGWWLNICS